MESEKVYEDNWKEVRNICDSYLRKKISNLACLCKTQ